MKQFTEKQQNFVNLIVQGIPQGQAARLAGYADSSADVQAAVLMKRPDIKAAVKAGKKTAGVSTREEAEVDDKPKLKDHYPDPKALLEDVMNNPKVNFGVRWQTAKDLLPYFHAKVGESGKKENQKKRAAELTENAPGGRQKFSPVAPPKLVSVK